MTLTDSEIEYIEGILGRQMNELEEGMLDVMFSEHCSYKSSRPILGTFPTEGENIILGPGDDAEGIWSCPTVTTMSFSLIMPTT